MPDQIWHIALQPMANAAAAALVASPGRLSDRAPSWGTSRVRRTAQTRRTISARPALMTATGRLAKPLGSLAPNIAAALTGCKPVVSTVEAAASLRGVLVFAALTLFLPFTAATSEGQEPPAPAPVVSTSVTPMPHALVRRVLSECRDDASFVDVFGYSCSDWAGYDCSTPSVTLGYSQANEDALLANCAATCSDCSAEPLPPLSTMDAALCPAWCLDRAVRGWSCDALDCQPCLEACLDIKPYQQAFTSLPTERAAVKLQQQGWTCPPTWPPRHFYVLFTSARSASTTTCSVINTLPDAFCADELLQKPNSASNDNRLLSLDPARFLQQRFESAFSDKHAAPYGAHSN